MGAIHYLFIAQDLEIRIQQGLSMSVMTSQHSNKLLRIIREMVVSWDIAEIGALTIDPEIPIGHGNFLDNLPLVPCQIS
jgi:hypothetical protein